MTERNTLALSAALAERDLQMAATISYGARFGDDVEPVRRQSRGGVAGAARLQPRQIGDERFIQQIEADDVVEAEFGPEVGRSQALRGAGLKGLPELVNAGSFDAKARGHVVAAAGQETITALVDRLD